MTILEMTSEMVSCSATRTLTSSRSNRILLDGGLTVYDVTSAFDEWTSCCYRGGIDPCSHTGRLGSQLSGSAARFAKRPLEAASNHRRQDTGSD